MNKEKNKSTLSYFRRMKLQPFSVSLLLGMTTPGALAETYVCPKEGSWFIAPGNGGS